MGSIDQAHEALIQADEQLSAAQLARAATFEALVAAVTDAGWRTIFRNGDRVVVEHLGGRSLELGDLVAELLRQGATA